MNNAASVKDRLKNLSKENGKTFQELLTLYGLERTIYRISKSRYVDNFTLKGGIFLYALFNGNYARATTDIDFLAGKIDNDLESIKEVFAEIFAIEVDDPLQFELDTLRVTSITELRKYHGVNISIVAFLDKTRVNVSIDIGFGDIIYPDRVMMDFPVMLSDEIPKLYTYSIVSSIAEKFEAIVSLAYDNSRFKDYYDIYVLIHNYDMEGHVICEAIRETFENRHTSIQEIVAFEDGFAEDTIRQTRWKSFVKTKKAMIPVTLEETINAIEDFMFPIVESIKSNIEMNQTWDCHEQSWK